MTGSMEHWLRRTEDLRARRGIVRDTVVHGDPRTTDTGGRRPLLDLASNDYLGLSRDPRLRAAAEEALSRHGTGARSSRVVSGTLQVHAELEEELCALSGRPSALAFSTGYAANLGALTALGGPGTLMVLDEHVHASLRDAARLSRSPLEIGAHGDVAAIRHLLRTRTQPRAVVVVESVYSVLGDAAPLAELAQLCAEHDAVLLVDEAHAVGVIGEGRGGAYCAGLAGADHVIQTMTLSKALGSQGGAVLGTALLRRHLVNTARSFIFDTALAPASAAAAAQACRILRAEPDQAAAVRRNAALIATACGNEPAPAAVQSVTVGSPTVAAGLAAQLEAEGILVGCFRPPSVPDGVSRLRLTARADLTSDEVVHAASRVAELVERS